MKTGFILIALVSVFALTAIFFANQAHALVKNSTRPRLLELPKLTAPAFRLFADGGSTVQELKERLTSYRAQADAITQTADNEKRDMTAEEASEVERLCDAFESTEKEIKRRERVTNMGSRLEQPSPRKVAADKPSSEDRAPITGGEPTKAAKGTMGFKAMSEFSRAVVNASLGRGRMDPRLTSPQDAAATTYGNEGTGADGGYLVPPDFRTEIMEKVIEDQDDLLARCDKTTTQSNAVSMVADESTPWETSGGLQAYWEGEAAVMPQSKAALKAVNIRAYKLTALVPITDEQLEDGPSLEAHIRRKAPQKIGYKINDAIMNGSGAGLPLGILKSPALITQAAEGGQTADTVNFNNITKMWSRMLARLRRNSVWITNQDLEPQLASLVIPGSNASFPAYLPAGAGLQGNPYATLMGRPILYSETTAAVGDVGDIVLADLSQYLAVMKSSGLKSDVSMHLWFDQGLTALRFTIRIGGAPWWAAPVARPGAKNTVSAFVTLAAR